MKLSKGVSLLMGLVLASGLGFLLTVGVLAENSKQLKLDPANRQQHIQVKLIQDSDSYRNYYANLGKIGESLTHITLYNGSNFVMDSNTSSSDGNFIDNNSSKSNILGGSGNKIQGARYATILGGYRNINSGGSNSTILGGRNNVITGDYNTVLGGENNAVYEGSGSSVAGGSGNVIFGDYSATIGNYNSVHGDYSLALGRNSKLRASNSFLWTDGSHPSEMLRNNNLFVVNSRSGMVVNASGAHSFAQLTIGGPLIVYDSWKDPQQCNSELKGVMKVVEGDNGQKCFCSCDGTGWNSMYGLGRCEGKCNPDLAPKCGNEITRQTSPTDGKFYYRGTCEVGYPVDGTGAYFVDKYSGIHWSCQTDDGQVVRCPDGEIIEPEDILCPEGEVYDETDGKCKKACVMTAGFGSITVMDKDGYAITVADRNLGATSTDVNDLTSFGCFYQWGNNCGFQPVGDITISTEKVNVSGVEPSSYKNCEYVVSPSCANNSRECTDSDWAQNPNHNLWGGGNDSSSNAFGVLDTDKVKRKGPCPEGWHVPGQGEWSDLLTIWYNKEYSQNLQYVKDTHKIQAFKDNENLVSKFRNKFYLAPAGSRSNIDATPDGMYQIGGSYWASSSPWKIGSLSSQSLIGDSRIGRFPNEAYSFDYSETYIGNGVRGVKNSGQSVRCFKDVPDCPLGSTWNPVTLKCECDNGGDIANNCGIAAQCTGSIPANATGNNNKLPTVSTGWYYSIYTGDACTYRCNSGYVYSGGLCENGAYLCQGTKPEHATLVSGSNLGLTGNVTNTLYENRLEASNNKCAYLCDNGYKKVGRHCIKASNYVCKNIRSHVKLVKDTDKNLEEDTEGTLYPKESLVPAGAKCAYICEEGYDYICANGTCSCAICEEGTYDENTYTCIIETVDCNGLPNTILQEIEGIPYCLSIGNCIYNKKFLKNIPEDGVWYDYALAQPIGMRDTNWSCVSGTPSEHACQYQCKPGMVCDGGKCINGPTTQSVDCGGTPPSTASHTHDVQSSKKGKYTKTWNGSTWEPESKVWTFWNTNYNTNGGECIFGCDSGYEWDGDSCSEPNSCGDVPSGATPVSQNPNSVGENYKYDSTGRRDGTSDGCWYRCKTEEGYKWNGTKCVSCNDDTLPMPKESVIIVSRNATGVNQSYLYSGGAISSSTGCYYKCNATNNYAWDGTKCVKNNCGSLPNGGEGIRVVSNNPESQGQAYRYDTYGNKNENSDGCWYRCLDNYTWNGTKCVKNNSCGPVPYGGKAVSTNPDHPDQEYVYDTYGNKNENSDGCWYRCDTNYTWDGDSCEADTQTKNCSTFNIANATPKVSTFTQTWNGSAWTPSSKAWTLYGKGETECVFECDINYTWNGSACKPKTRTTESCGGNIPANATKKSGHGKFKQTWNGQTNKWEPESKIWEYDASECGFLCDSDYDWDNNSCKIKNSCTGLPSGITTANAYIYYNPTQSKQKFEYDKNANSSSSCKYKCKEDFFYKNGNCVEVSTLCDDDGCDDDNGNGCTWEDTYNGCRWSRQPAVLIKCPDYTFHGRKFKMIKYPIVDKYGEITDFADDCVRCVEGTTWVGDKDNDGRYDEGEYRCQ